MKALRIAIQLVMVLLIIAAGVLFATFLIATKKEPEKIPKELTLPAVEVISVQKTNPSVLVKAQGEFFPTRETTLSASVAGEIIYVSEKYETGEKFAEGEVILRIDDVDYKTALVNAQTAERQILSSVKEAEVALKLEVARAEQALRDWQKLGRGEEPSELLLRKPQIAAAEARVVSATASIDQARANIEQAQRNLDRTIVKAPYDCQLSSKNLDLGALATAGMPLFTVFEQGSVKGMVPVSLEDAGFVDLKESKISASAVIAGQSQSWTGELVRSENRIDPRTRSITMIAHFSGEDKPPVGLLADFEITGKKMTEVYEVPRVALIGGNKVLVVNDEDKLQYREVVVARSGAEVVYLRSGVQDGDRVCVTVLNRPVEGMQVQVINNE